MSCFSLLFCHVFPVLGDEQACINAGYEYEASVVNECSRDYACCCDTLQIA